jgi:hypothetical protein
LWVDGSLTGKRAHNRRLRSLSIFIHNILKYIIKRGFYKY